MPEEAFRSNAMKEGEPHVLRWVSSWVPACSSDALSLHFAYGSEAEMSFTVICLKVFFSTDY